MYQQVVICIGNTGCTVYYLENIIMHYFYDFLELHQIFMTF